MRTLYLLLVFTIFTLSACTEKEQARQTNPHLSVNYEMAKDFYLISPIDEPYEGTLDVYHRKLQVGVWYLRSSRNHQWLPAHILGLSGTPIPDLIKERFGKYEHTRIDTIRLGLEKISNFEIILLGDMEVVPGKDPEKISIH